MVRLVTVELRKYPSRPLRTYTGRRLGEDEFGTWVAVAPNTPIFRGNEEIGRSAAAFVVVLPQQQWWKARLFHDGGWKVDITTPSRWNDGTVILEDLDLDVRRIGGNSWIEDQDEFAASVALGVYPPAVQECAQETARELLEALRSNDEPFANVGVRWSQLATELTDEETA